MVKSTLAYDQKSLQPTFDLLSDLLAFRGSWEAKQITTPCDTIPTSFSGSFSHCIARHTNLIMKLRLFKKKSSLLHHYRFLQESQEYGVSRWPFFEINPGMISAMHAFLCRKGFCTPNLSPVLPCCLEFFWVGSVQSFQAAVRPGPLSAA